MAQDRIAADVEAFIDAVIDSVATMEALMLASRARDKRWSVVEVAHRLYVDEARAHASLDRLAQHGCLRRDAESYWYDPESAELSAFLDRVVHTYDRKLIAVTNLIHSRVRPSITEFAKAFRMRKEK